VGRTPSAIADAFCATRLSERPGFAYGAPASQIDANTILARAAPFV
jgi:hypothetical protein